MVSSSCVALTRLGALLLQEATSVLRPLPFHHRQLRADRRDHLGHDDAWRLLVLKHGVCTSSCARRIRRLHRDQRAGLVKLATRSPAALSPRARRPPPSHSLNAAAALTARRRRTRCTRCPPPPHSLHAAAALAALAARRRHTRCPPPPHTLPAAAALAAHRTRCPPLPHSLPAAAALAARRTRCPPPPHSLPAAARRCRLGPPLPVPRPRPCQGHASCLLQFGLPLHAPPGLGAVRCASRDHSRCTLHCVVRYAPPSSFSVNTSLPRML